MRAALIVVLALGIVSQVSAECANACSGHGVCKNSDQCDCFPNYNAADCSQRVCPYGLAWVDSARGDLNHDGLVHSAAVPVYTFTDDTTVTVNDYELYNGDAQGNEAHFYSECSNKGLCDRDAGLCVCYEGYTGSSCQRSTCPNDCSGNGVCRTVQEVAAGAMNASVAAGSAFFTDKHFGLNRQQLDNKAGKKTYGGVTTSTLYRLWDSDMAQTCVCDAGFSGADCSRRECPRGDDPLTHRFGDCPKQPNQASYTDATPCKDEVQLIEISQLTAAADAADWFHFLYRDWTGKIWRTDDFLVGDIGLTVCSVGTTLPLLSTSDTVKAGIKTALLSIPNDIIGDLTISDGTVTATNTGYAYEITFTKNSGNLYALTLVNSADMQTNLPQCEDSVVNFGVGGGLVQVTEQQDGNKEASTCSNRGVCNFDSGLCKCFKGYYGGDCSMQNALSQ